MKKKRLSFIESTVLVKPLLHYRKTTDRACRNYLTFNNNLGEFVGAHLSSSLQAFQTQCISSNERTYNVVHSDPNEIQAALSLDNPTEC